MKATREISTHWLAALIVSHLVLPAVWVIWLGRRLLISDDRWAALFEPLPWVLFAANWLLNIVIFLACALNYAKRTEQDIGGKV